MLKSEREKLLNLEQELHKRVIGQDDAIIAISEHNELYYHDILVSKKDMVALKI